MAEKKAKPSKAKKSAKPSPATHKSRSLARGAASALQDKPIELPNGMWERIAMKAYELWEQRGRREGYDLEDWFEAETIVMEEIHEARE